MDQQIEAIRRVKDRHEKRWLGVEGVVGVGIGTTAGGSVGLIVSVKTDAARVRSQIPTQIEGVDVEIRESGEFRALQGPGRL